MDAKRMAENALLSQGACNLSGIVISFAEIMKEICEESNRLGKGTNWKNTHPVCRLFAEQIHHLAFMTSDYDKDDSDRYSAAYAACKTLAGQEVQS